MPQSFSAWFCICQRCILAGAELLKLEPVDMVTWTAVKVIPASKVSVRPALNTVNPAEIPFRAAAKVRPAGIHIVLTAL